MRFIERLLYYPVLLSATGLAVVATYRHPGPVGYAGLGLVATLWLISFVRSVLWFTRVVFYLTCVGGLIALWAIKFRP